MARAGTKLTKQMLLDAKEMFDKAPVPTENRFIIPYMETEPMETTQTTVTETTTTERTAEDIIKSLSDGTYFTKNKQLLVSRGNCWSSTLKVVANPNHRGSDIYLSNDTLEELSQLSDLLKAHEDKQDTAAEIRYTVELLNKKGK